jgi:hypothetical protein
MGSSVGTPPPRDYAQETRDTLQAQIDLAPAQYAAESEYRPKYAQLDLATLRDTLNGTGANKGLLDLYENDVYPTLSRVEAADRSSRTQADLDLIQSKAGDVTTALRKAAGTSGLVDTMARQAQEGLDAGASVDPSLANEISQGVRAAQSSRGFGFSAPDAVTEAYARGSTGEALRNSRRQFAGQTVSTLQATGGDPVMALLGRPSQVLGMGQSFGAQGQSFNPGTMFSPESAYAGDVNNTNFNAKAAAKIAQANNDTAITSAGISAAGSMASSL